MSPSIPLGCTSGTAEREAAFHMITRASPGARRITLGADKGYDAASFVEDLRQMAVTPQIARNDAATKTGKRRRSRIDGRTTRHTSYAASQHVRKRIEEAFAWAETIAGLAETKLRGTPPQCLQVHLHDGRLQSDPNAETARRRVSGEARPNRNQDQGCPTDVLPSKPS
jgi:hypothetical protein